VSDAGETARIAASAIHRASVGTARFTGRAYRAYRSLHYERRLAAIAAILLFFTLFLPWYQETVIANGATDRSSLRHASVSLSGWGAFSWVEAAVLLVAVGVLALLFQRAEGRAFHLPGGDGWIITLAGLWTCGLVVWRIFDKQGTSTTGQLAENWGIEWGIFVTLAVAVLLTYSGSAIRAAHAPEPPLPGEEGYGEQAKRGTRSRSSGRGSGFYIPHASPTSETVAYDPGLPDADHPGLPDADHPDLSDPDHHDDPDAEATEALPPQRPAPRRAGPPPQRARRPQAREEPPRAQPPRAPRPAGPPRAAGTPRSAGPGGRPPSERRTGWLTSRPMDPDDFPEDEFADEPPQRWDVSDFDYDRRVRSQRGRLPQGDPAGSGDRAEYEDLPAGHDDGPADDVAYYDDEPHHPRPARPRPPPPRTPEPYDIDASEDETIVGPFRSRRDASEDETVIDRRYEPHPYDADDPDDTLIDPTPRTERLSSGGSEDKTVANSRWRRKRPR
jgi:hypothetical protein